MRLMQQIYNRLPKTEAPFWKKEFTDHGSYWVNEKEADHKQKMSWDIAKEND